MTDTIDWAARFRALSEIDDLEAWEAEDERLEAEWTAAYSEAFVSIAVARGWQREDAESWPEHISQDAYMEKYQFEFCPRRSAEADVIMCEEPL